MPRSPVVVALAAVAVGGTTGLLGTSVHLAAVDLGVQVPFGVALAVALLGTGHLWLILWARRRWPLIPAAVVWGLVCGVAATPRPEGDLLLPGATVSVVWLAVGCAVPAVLAFVPRLPPPARPASPVAVPTGDPVAR